MNLAERLKARLDELGVSPDEVSRRAATKGAPVSRTSIYRYANPDKPAATTPRDDVLAGFAAGLDMDLKELRILAGYPTDEPWPWEPPEQANKLTVKQRRNLEALIRSMVGE